MEHATKSLSRFYLDLSTMRQRLKCFCLVIMSAASWLTLIRGYISGINATIIHFFHNKVTDIMMHGENLVKVADMQAQISLRFR